MILALSGGIGGSKLALGFSRTLPPSQFTVLANTGDDMDWLGLRICPDLDTLMYTLSGRVDPIKGWGIDGDTFACLGALGGLEEETWFNVGDRDLALHLWRSHKLRLGCRLTDLTRQACTAFGLQCQVLPMTDAYAPTWVLTDMGELHLQEYFVRERCRPVVRGFRYAPARTEPPVELAEVVSRAKAIVLCPSNPFISIDPILAVSGVRDLLRRAACPVIAVSPIVGGKSIKGPTAKMLQQLGFETSAESVAARYADVCDIFVLDSCDAALKGPIEAFGMQVSIADTVMETVEDKERLARHIVKLT